MLALQDGELRNSSVQPAGKRCWLMGSTGERALQPWLGREMKGIFYNTLGSTRRMLCLAWTGLTWCVGFFSYNAGNVAIKEIQR